MPSSGTKPSIVFFGSGPVAAKSLKLLSKHQEIEAVITKPATNREMQLSAPDNTTIYTVSTKQELDKLINSTSLSSKVGVLIDFGIIVSQKVIDNFSSGIINSHFSLLPEWRGADPISFSILSGQEKTGVSLMVLDVGMDTGEILVQKPLAISSSDTTSTLTEKLIVLSDQLLKDNLGKYLSGLLKSSPQPRQNLKIYSRKLQKNDGQLDFTKPAAVLEREIRAFEQWPKSRTTAAGKDIIVVSAEVDTALSGKISEIFITDDKKIGIYCKTGALIINELKPAGKNSMSSQAFIAGYGDKILG